jgi:hypothetical protein
MDVYLSDEALLFLRAEMLTAPGRRPSGLLLGHTRARRFFVERVYPCPQRAFARQPGYWALERLFGGKIIGFYSSGPAKEKAPALYQPFAFNKLWLELEASAGAVRPELKPFLVEYDGSFSLRPLAIAALETRK